MAELLTQQRAQRAPTQHNGSYRMSTPNSNPDFTIVPPGTNKSDTAKLLYPGISFDTTLPQDWVNSATRPTPANQIDIRPHFIWGYPAGSLLGRPLPITQTGSDWLHGQQA